MDSQTEDQDDDFDAVAEVRRAVIARRHLPSELIHRPLLKWPADVESLTGIADGVLRARQAMKDAPKFTRIGRQIFVRPRDLLAWIDAHAAAEG